MAGPDGMSHTAESNTPPTAHVIPMIMEYHVSVERLCVNW